MSAKPESAEPAAPAPAAAPPPAGGIKSWLPVIAALLLAPVATWATVEFVLVPRLQKKLEAPSNAEGERAKAAAADAEVERLAQAAAYAGDEDPYVKPREEDPSA
jgi:hypothetical protein